MAKVFFKRGLASEYGSNEPNLEDSIIFKSNVAPQLSGFSEIYLGSKLVGVGHQFGYGFAGIVPAPSELDRGKILSTDGWMSPEDIQGATDVYQNPIGGSSQDRYPLLLKGTADVAPETGDVNFSGMLRNGNPILSATAGGDMFAKSLTVNTLVKSPGFLVSNPNGSPISGLTAETYIKADGSGYGGVFTGAGASAGSAGLVPAPAIGDAGKYLKGDGTWGEIQGGTQSDWEEDDSTDPSYVQNRPAVRAGTGDNATIEGNIAINEASGDCSHAEGTGTKSIGIPSHSEGYGTISYGNRTHSEGFGYAHNPNYYPDASFKLTGPANSQFYALDTLDGCFSGMVIYYNGVYAKIESAAENEGSFFLYLDKTLDSANALSNATVKIVTGTASGLQSHSEGGSTRAYGNASHSEGNCTLAINLYEHAQGNYNKSNQVISTFGNAGNTLNSIGIGTSEATRKNAVEVMQNGDVYVYGVGSYNGTNPNTTGVKTLQDVINNPSEYTIEKLNQAETGYASSYILKKGNTQVGATINIPKDMVVSAGEVKTCTQANVPVQGLAVGDKYIDLTIANSSNSHIYIPVKDLMDVYTEGNGIDISSSNVVSIQLDSANANGLETTSAGLKLNTVTTTAAGAMSSTDKTNLDTIYSNYLKAGNTIGTISVTEFNPVSDTVHVTPQSLGDSQKTQARSNISAQESLVSGTNIKTINGQSILGSGNLEISGGGGSSITVDTELSNSSTNPVQNRVINTALSGKVGDVRIGSSSIVSNGIATIPSSSVLPTVTTADEGKILRVSNGAWALVVPSSIYTGSGAPDNSLGNNGDIYLQTS